MADQDEVKELAHNIVAGWSPQAQIAYRDSEIASARAAEQRRINREAAERKQVEQQEARRLEAAERFGQEVRADFFRRNPQCTQADFERLWPKLRDEALLRSNQGANMEVERQHPRYNF